MVEKVRSVTLIIDNLQYLLLLCLLENESLSFCWQCYMVKKCLPSSSQSCSWNLVFVLTAFWFTDTLLWNWNQIISKIGRHTKIQDVKGPLTPWCQLLCDRLLQAEHNKDKLPVKMIDGKIKISSVSRVLLYTNLFRLYVNNAVYSAKQSTLTLTLTLKSPKIVEFILLKWK